MLHKSTDAVPVATSNKQFKIYPPVFHLAQNAGALRPSLPLGRNFPPLNAPPLAPLCPLQTEFKIFKTHISITRICKEMFAYCDEIKQ